MDMQHLEELHGLPVFDFPERDRVAELPSGDSVAWRISVEPYGDSPEEFSAAWARFSEAVDFSQVRALVIGQWGESGDEATPSEMVELLVAAKDRLSVLEALFIGDFEQEQAEISWITQADLTPVANAFTELRELGVRGGTNLEFSAVALPQLRRLTFQAGGLPAKVVQGIGESDLPALEHLEIWLGVDEYGGDATVDELAAILGGERLPSLRHLGIRNAEIQDEVAAAVASAPVVAQLTSLDLSLGQLTDDGAAALLAGQSLTHLHSLDLHHHFLSDDMISALRAAFDGHRTTVDTSEQLEMDDEWRYVAISE